MRNGVTSSYNPYYFCKTNIAYPYKEVNPVKKKENRPVSLERLGDG